MDADVRVHPTADVSPAARIGAGTSVWHQAQVREGARIGRNCILSKGVYVDVGVVLGNNVKVQNHVSIHHGVTIDDGVFCGPHCVFTNDKWPRAINRDGSLRAAGDWTLSETRVKTGASIGANAVIVCGVTIGAWAMIGAGSVVTCDVPDHGLVWGNPARLHGFICPCGHRLPGATQTPASSDVGRICYPAQPSSPGASMTPRAPASAPEAEATVTLICAQCKTKINVSKADWDRVR